MPNRGEEKVKSLVCHANKNLFPLLSSIAVKKRKLYDPPPPFLLFFQN